ncbi:hypothetical protein LAWI1_G001145 [Lachnellula willkommii]|uniref:F-box domain-containing protein n=1 Tax=Lachnellula willkommii TaxID=215461 RepID=A0A559MMW6_9HELO|nr:hypothetical protein LAWI1_G001145 [Lachnellula willkommii]
MALANLPHELLDIIIEYSLPQSFENLATTCKRIYARCTPFIQRHNELRSRFRHFVYHAHARDSLVAASDLISLIAADPIVARYIRIANLVEDSKFLSHLRVRGEPPKSVPSIEDGGATVQLFANSTYLRRARLDWREYYSTFAEDVREMRYSQHGSAFLLTLLADTENLTIPSSWKPNAATNQLLDVLAQEAQQSCFLSSGLRSVTTFLGSLSRSETENWGLSWASPFLALPHLKSFSGPGSFAVGENPTSLAFRGSPHIADTLEAAHLGGCCIDDVGISDFLKHTPRLKTLRYSHSTQHDHLPLDWDICKFINAVAREAGSHLIELSVKILELRGSILPGKASTRSFQKLEKFEFPLKLVTCNINAAGVTGNIATSLQCFFNGSLDPFVRDLIPPSVTHLSLKSEGMGPHDKALDALFRHFRAVRRSQLPNLQEVHIACKQEADNAYKQQCNKIVAEGGREGVVVHLHAYEYSGGLNWDG